MMLTAAQRETMQKHEWFHALELGDGVVTCGRFPRGQPQNQTLFSVFDFLSQIDVSGMDCLDIGATDGLVSFGLERLGAKTVVATDRVAGAGFLTVHELLQSKVEHKVPVEIGDIHAVLDDRRFDLIVCAGVIYHMLNPLSAIMACRALLKPGGLLIVESAMSWVADQAFLVLNSEEQHNMESSTYWLPTPKALKGMVRLCHFEMLGGRWQSDIGRGAVLGRAVGTNQPTPGASVLTRAMQEHGLLDYEFQRRLSNADAVLASSIAFRGEARELELRSSRYVPNFPFHAHRPNPETALGLRDWKIVPSS